MTDLVLSSVSQSHADRLMRTLPQSLLLSGIAGVGLHTIAKQLSKAHGNVITLVPELLTKTSTIPQIGIEKVRELYEQTRTRTTTSRIVVIDDADAMTIPAQNAFLKLLEEPNQSTKFILTSHNPETLLPTIRSRLQQCHITPVSKEQTSKLIDALPGLTAQKRAQLLFIAEGLPAELHRLTSDEMVFREKAALIGTAKRLIEGDAFTRVVAIQKEKLTRHSADTLAQQLIMLLGKHPSPAGIEKISRLLDARERIAAGGNIKIQLLAALV